MIVYTVYMIMRFLEVKNIFHTTKPQSPASSKLEWCWKRQAARNAEYEISCDASAVNLRTWSPEGFSCKLGFKHLYDSCKIMFCKAQEIHRAEIPFDHQILRLVVYPMIFRFSYILGGFSLDFSHQPATSPHLVDAFSFFFTTLLSHLWNPVKVVLRFKGSCWDSLRCYRSAVNKTKKAQIMRLQLHSSSDHPIATICDLEKKTLYLYKH